METSFGKKKKSTRDKFKAVDPEKVLQVQHELADNERIVGIRSFSEDSRCAHHSFFQFAIAKAN